LRATSFLTLEPGTPVVDRPPEARYDRVDVTEADRDEAIECPFPEIPFVSQATVHSRRKP